MERTERFYKLEQLLDGRQAVPMEMLIETLGVSRATIKRDLEYLRDRMNAPIVWDRVKRGYRWDRQACEARFQLPGIWFSASEIHALLTMEHLLAGIRPSFLGARIAPLRTRIRNLLDSGDHSAEEVTRRIRILHMASRPVEPAQFQAIASALLSRRRLRIAHYNRVTDATLEREVSPQRLVYYRDNWYLDGWCHLRKALRSFGVDVIRGAAPIDRPARDIDDVTLDRVLGSGYGIFGGSDTQSAVLRFTPHRARWIAREEWHPAQAGHFDEQGYYVLTLPYSNDTELTLDILKYGPDVEVLEPAALRQKVGELLRVAASRYES